MTIEEMKRKKTERGYSYSMMSELSGIPLGTIQKIFSGETTHPRYDTLMALEKLFQDPPALQEHFAYSTKHAGTYTVDDYYALPEEQRRELIDGTFYDMSAPTVLHQRICGEIYRQFSNYILEQGGECLPLMSPLDVQLDRDNKTMVQPDMIVLCENQDEKLCNWGIYGAPDFVLEVLSPSTKKKDCFKKLSKYADAGVLEYWILDPYQKKLLIYFFEEDVIYPKICGLNQPVPVNIYQGKLLIDFDNIASWLS